MEPECHLYAVDGETVPDLAWDLVDIHVADELMIVRDEATGTPVAEFRGRHRSESPSIRWR